MKETLLAERLAFFRAWLFNPQGVAAIAPSSQALAKLITSEITSETGLVVEFGPGTGIFTDALISRGIKERQLVLIEHDENFAKKLKHLYKDAQIICMDASLLKQEFITNKDRVGAIVSGLPMLFFPKYKIIRILENSFNLLGFNGALYQFTYGLSCPIPISILDELGLDAEKIGSTFLNIPPASVYRVYRRPDASTP